MEKFYINDPASLVLGTDEGSGNISNFFGYYYPSPLSKCGNRLLSHQSDFDGRDVRENDSVAVGYWDLNSKNFIHIGSTRAFNWQQGSMLQWLPGGNDKKIIFNQRGDEAFVSVIYDIDSEEKTTVSYPVYTLHPSGDFALAVNYEHLYFCRPGYNYQGVVNAKWDKFFDPEDGIYRVHLPGGKTEQIISTTEVMRRYPRNQMKNGHNWLEHMMFNPSGTRFAFLHRWENQVGSFFSRLFTADPDGSSPYMFPDTGFYSHMGWRNEVEFTIWGRKYSTFHKRISSFTRNKTVNLLFGDLYRTINKKFKKKTLGETIAPYGFLKFKDLSQEFEFLGDGVLTNDGHNTWTRDGRWMLTDTYADVSGYRHLLLYDSFDNKVREIGRFFSPFNDCGYRCDLHPRFDHSEDLVIIDSAHTGRRQMYILNIAGLKQQ